MFNEIRNFKGTNDKTYKGLFVGHFSNAHPIPYFDQKTIDKYLSQFSQDDITYLTQSQILGFYCPFAQTYILGDFELPKINFEGKAYFCFALDMQFQLIKINQ